MGPIIPRSGSYIQQTITLTSPSNYPNGDYYVIVINNPNSYSVTVNISFNLNSITCNG